MRFVWLAAIMAVFFSASPVFAKIHIEMLPPLVEAEINLAHQRMAVYVNGEKKHLWKISSGRRGYSTPVGTYQPYRMHTMWRSRKYHNAPMPHSLFFHGGYAIHGTTSIYRLGRRASHGCIRLHPANARKLFKLVLKHKRVRTRVTIVNDRSWRFAVTKPYRAKLLDPRRQRVSMVLPRPRPVDLVKRRDRSENKARQSWNLSKAGRKVVAVKAKTYTAPTFIDRQKRNRMMTVQTKPAVRPATYTAPAFIDRQKRNRMMTAQTKPAVRQATYTAPAFIDRQKRNKVAKVFEQNRHDARAPNLLAERNAPVEPRLRGREKAKKSVEIFGGINRPHSYRLMR